MNDRVGNTEVKPPLTFGSLFAGIGGFDLGFERAGMVCKWQVEIDDYANKVLAKHWPNVHRERDIRECGCHNLERVDVICGGFPCQDISYAGQGAGLDGERSGLFFEAVRVVRELRPRIVVLENVAALLTRGLDRVLGTLAEIGYDAEWHCIPAAAVGAPHIRDRVFILAYSRSERVQRRANRSGNIIGQRANGEIAGSSEISDAISEHDDDGGHGAGTVRGKRSESPHLCRSEDNVADANESFTSEERIQRSGEQLRTGCNHGKSEEQLPSDTDIEFAQDGRESASPPRDSKRVRNLSDSNGKRLEMWEGQDARGTRSNCWSEPVRSEWWFTKPELGRVANGISSRVDRLRGIGNAVVPQVAEWIGRRIVEGEE